jgi:hypothetical protein
MRTFARVGSRILGLALPLVAGCVTSGGPVRQSSKYDELMRIRDSLRQVVQDQQSDPQASEPRVHIITPAILGANRYVESSFRVNEDAYVVVVAVDYDGRARVTFPEAPTESGFVRANTLHRLPTFFAGFGTSRLAMYAGSRYGMLHPAFGGSGGLIVAVASARPLQLQRLATDDGDWDEIAIERLLWSRSGNAAGYVLGRVVALTGQDFDTDYSGFTQGLTRASYMFASFGSSMCDEDSRSLSGVYYNSAPQSSVAYVVIDGVEYARLTRVDWCSGRVNQQLVPIGPVQRPPQNPGDSARTDSSSTAAATRIARVRHVGTPVDGGSSGLAERPVARRGTIGSPADDRDDGSLRRPMIDRGLRFLPPKRVREDGTFRRSDGESVQEELLRQRQTRRASDEREGRSAPQRNPEQQRPTRAEPSRSEPAAIERTTSTPSSGGATTERTGKPVKGE